MHFYGTACNRVLSIARCPIKLVQLVSLGATHLNAHHLMLGVRRVHTNLLLLDTLSLRECSRWDLRIPDVERRRAFLR